MKWFPRTRATIRLRIWQYMYAQEVMHRTKYGFGEAIEQAIIAQMADGWEAMDPEETAVHRIGLLCPPHMLR